MTRPGLCLTLAGCALVGALGGLLALAAAYDRTANARQACLGAGYADVLQVDGAWYCTAPGVAVAYVPAVTTRRRPALEVTCWTTGRMLPGNRMESRCVPGDGR